MIKDFVLKASTVNNKSIVVLDVIKNWKAELEFCTGIVNLPRLKLYARC